MPSFNLSSICNLPRKYLNLFVFICIYFTPSRIWLEISNVGLSFINTCMPRWALPCFCEEVHTAGLGWASTWHGPDLPFHFSCLIFKNHVSCIDAPSKIIIGLAILCSFQSRARFIFLSLFLSNISHIRSCTIINAKTTHIWHIGSVFGLFGS